MKKLLTIAICLFISFGITKADDDKPINVNELPQKAQVFIRQNFPKNEVSYAKMEKDFWDKKYEIVFVNGEKIEFDKNSNWEEVDCTFSFVPDTVIPKQIRDHISKQYPQSKIIKIERDTKEYEVKLNNKLELKYTPTFQLKEIDHE